MAVKTFSTARSAQYNELVRQLVAEWKQPAAVQPAILEERDHQEELNHIYVVWDAFQRLDRAQRSSIVMDAAELRYGRSGVAGVTIAMGLTPDEADAMEVAWR